MKFYIILFLFLLNFSGFGQSKTISRTEALNEIDSLFFYINEIHPNAYAYQTELKIRKIYEKAKRSIPDSLTVYQLFNQLSYIASTYKNGHLSILFPRKWYEDSVKVIPFCVDIEDEKLFAQKVSFSCKIPEGAKILKINGITSTKLIRKMICHQSGESSFFRKERVKQHFPELLYSLFNMQDSFQVTYRNKGKKLNETLQAIPYKIYAELAKRESSVNPYQSKFMTDIKTCIIDFRSFDNLEHFKQFLETCFRKIKQDGIEFLIIDVRNNLGGQSILGNELFQYIAKEPFEQYGKMSMKISRHLKNLWEKYYFPKGIIDSMALANLQSIPNGEVLEGDEEELISLRENPFRFFGKTYVLTSSATFSSAADFAWCFKHYKMGKVVGEETGGWGFCYGDNVYVELPVSKIAINVACKLFCNVGANETSTHGVKPDVKINADEALDYVIRLIKENNTTKDFN